MKETMMETEVRYLLERGGKFYIIEYVPARVCRETGEQLFSPETVEHIHSLIKGEEASKSNRDPGLRMPMNDSVGKNCRILLIRSGIG